MNRSISVHVKQLKSALKNKKVKLPKSIYAILLFGSGAKDIFHSKSDIDLAFLGYATFDQCLTIAVKIQQYFDRELDWVLLNETCDPVLAKEVFQNYEIVWSTDINRISSLYSLKIRMYDDQRYWRKINVSGRLK